MKSESITLVVKNRLTTLEEEVGDQQYKDNLSERNQIIAKNHLPEDEDEDVEYMTEDQIKRFLAEGGELEYV